jgi:hypothetical protein
VGGSGKWYLKAVCDYVHLNLVPAGLLGSRARLSNLRWSSYGKDLKPAGRRPKWLTVERVLGEWGIPKDSPAGREHFERMLETRRAVEAPEQVKRIERGWCYGSREF